MFAHGFGQIGEKLHHFGAGLEVVAGRDAPPLAVGDEAPFGDGEQRVVRIIVIWLCKERLVRADQRQAQAIGEIDEFGLDGPLHLRAVALDLDIEAVGKGLREISETRLREVGPAGGERAVDGAVRPAGQADQPLAGGEHGRDRKMRRLAGRGIHECP